MSIMDEYRQKVNDRLQGRDVQKIIDKMIEDTEDLILRELGMPEGMVQSNDDQMLETTEIIAEEVMRVYFQWKG